MESGREYVIPLNIKYIRIYDRTKNRRIKKKQIKKAPIIEVRNAILKQMRNIKKENIQVFIGNKKIDEEHRSKE